MAAYAATVTLDTPRANRIGNTPFGITMGVCTLSNYNTTQAEITGITGEFRDGGALRVMCDAVSSNGFVPRWNSTSLAFEAFISDPVDGGVLVEATTDDDVGTFAFVAFGQM